MEEESFYVKTDYWQACCEKTSPRFPLPARKESADEDVLVVKAHLAFDEVEEGLIGELADEGLRNAVPEEGDDVEPLAVAVDLARERADGQGPIRVPEAEGLPYGALNLLADADVPGRRMAGARPGIQLPANFIDQIAGTLEDAHALREASAMPSPAHPLAGNKKGDPETGSPFP